MSSFTYKSTTHAAVPRNGRLLDGRIYPKSGSSSSWTGNGGSVAQYWQLITQDADGNDVAFLYNWDGSGTEGDDLYFKASVNGNTYTFTVESYLCDKTTDVYAAVKALKIGDKIDMDGFLYWYEAVNPHITAVTPAE